MLIKTINYASNGFRIYGIETPCLFKLKLECSNELHALENEYTNDYSSKSQAIHRTVDHRRNKLINSQNH